MNKCRVCHHDHLELMLDLGFAPPSNSFLKKSDLNSAEVYYPLTTYVCQNCFLVQIDEYKKHDEIFSKDYVYFSSVSKSWVQHSADYSEKIIQRLGLNSKHFVVEIASNDGYLLQNFTRKNIPCLGIEPTLSTAEVAIKKGIPTLSKFFGKATATEVKKDKGPANLIAANNVLAHVPDLHDFVGGLQILLAPQGMITIEFPHLLNLMKENQFDTIYHEHFSYLSLLALTPLFVQHGLHMVDVEQLSTHGGSLRIFVAHQNSDHHVSDRVEKVLTEEKSFGLNQLQTYLHFQKNVEQIKIQFLEWLLQKRKQGRKVHAYGAAAKGNTFLNFCGVKNDLIQVIYDGSPYKQGLYLPGSHIPVMSPDKMSELQPDDIIILPWNLLEEIKTEVQKKYSRKDVVFVRFIPELKEISANASGQQL